MARKCPDCGHMNDNEMAFCTECGEPLDPQVRLVMELEGKKAPTSHSGARSSSADADYSSNRSSSRYSDDDDDDNYTPLYQEEEKKKFPVALIFVLAAAAIAVYLFLR